MLWAKTSGVFGGPQFQQNYSIMSLVTNTSVWEGDTGLCMSKLALIQKIPGVYAENPRSLYRKSQEFTLLLTLELSQHMQHSSGSHISLKPHNARSERSLL